MRNESLATTAVAVGGEPGAAIADLHRFAHPAVLGSGTLPEAQPLGNGLELLGCDVHQMKRPGNSTFSLA